jgi:hypothetical protein
MTINYVKKDRLTPTKVILFLFFLANLVRNFKIYNRYLIRLHKSELFVTLYHGFLKKTIKLRVLITLIYMK